MSTWWRVLPLLLVGAILVGCLHLGSGGDGLPLGKPAPEIKGTDSAGREFKLSDYRGKVVMLSFWKLG